MKRFIFAAVLLLSYICASAQIPITASFPADGGAAANGLMEPKGAGLYHTGEAFAWSGAGIAASSAILYVVGMMDFKEHYNPETPTMPMAPVFAMAGAGIGACVALLSVPMMSFGKRTMDSSGGYTAIEFGGPSQKGWSAIFELGGILPPYFQPRFGYGYHFNEKYFVGAGISHTFVAAGDGDDYTPVYIDTRFSFTDRKISPYFGIDFGYELGSGSLYNSFNSGIRIRKSPGTTASWWIASQVEHFDEGLTIGMKAGLSF